MECRLVSRDGTRLKRVRVLDVSPRGLVTVRCDGAQIRFYLSTGRQLGQHANGLPPWTLHPESIPALKEQRKAVWLTEE